MTAKIFELGHTQTARPAPPGERLADPETFRRLTDDIKPCGVRLRYAEGLKASERRDG